MPGRIARYYKAPIENKQYSVDYSKWLNTGETISSVTSSVTADGFIIPAVTPLTVSAQVASGSTAVSYTAQAGDSGETYEVLITIATSAGQVRQDLVIFVVRVLG